MQLTAEEELLLARCVRREPDAMETLADRCGTPLYGFLLTLFANPDEGRDILVQSFADTLRSVRIFEEKIPFLLHLARGVLEAARNRFAAGVKNPPAKKKSGAGRLDLIAESLSEIDLEDRILILLRDQLDFSFSEIAHLLGESEAQLRHRLTAARLRFRDILEEKMHRGDRGLK